MGKIVENISKLLLPKLFWGLTLSKFFLLLSQFIQVLKIIQVLKQILEEIGYFHNQLLFPFSSLPNKDLAVQIAIYNTFEGDIFLRVSP